MNRDFKGIWFPKHIWLDKEMSFIEKALIMEIDSLECDDGCWASNSHFANFIGKADKTVENMISDLVKKGVIIKRGSGSKRRLMVSPLIHDSWFSEPEVSRSRESFKANTPEVGSPLNNSSNTEESNTTDCVSAETSKPTEPLEDKKVNWENCHNDLQRFIAFYIKNWNETLYEKGTREQVTAFYATYGKMFKNMLGVAGSLEIACNTIVYFDRHFKKEGWSWNLKTLNINFPEFVNYAMSKKKEELDDNRTEEERGTQTVA